MVASGLSGEALASHPPPGLRPFSLGALLRGVRVYEFAEFYDAKNALLRYDGRRDYLNYGYWPDGEATANPSAALVAEVARAARAGTGDIVLTLGSGLGQPDLDLVTSFGVARVIGLNLHAGQVAYANRCARQAGLDHVIEHRVGDAQQASAAVADLAPTRILAIESLAEMPDLAAVCREAFRLLVPGGRLALCDVVTRRRAGAVRRTVDRTLTGVTSLLYGDSWREVGDYSRALGAAGFDRVEERFIGAGVYGPTYRFARQRFAELRRLPRAGAAAAIAYANLRAIERLFAMGAVDYAIVSAEKPR
jgi:cyclopropane fatty-acyl-phospholipid synthase-like methyltransferase